MNKSVQEAADRAINRAISADEQANTNYYHVVRRFISSKSAFAKEKLCQSDAILDAGFLKEIDAAWLKIEDTGKRLRKLYMGLL